MAASAGDALNVTFVIPYFYPAWQYGGQPRSAYELARALARRGHRIKVLTTDSAGQSRISAGRRNIDGIDVIYYRNFSNWLAYKKRIFWPRALFRELTRELAGSDILHIHELRSTLSVPAYRAALKLRMPYVLSTHGGIRHLGKRYVKRIFDALWGIRILRGAAAVIAISPVEETDVVSFDLDIRKLQRLPNAVSIADYMTLPKKGLFRAKWALSSNKVILFLGRLHWIKGADLLINAFHKIHPAHSGVRLIIAGSDDGQERELRELAANLGLRESVIFTGYLDDPAKLEAFVDADVLVIPSRSEVFAITAIEGLMCGCPVLLSGACGLFPLPEPQHGVRLFETDSIGDLAEKLSVAIVDESFKLAAQGGRQFVTSEFGPEKVGARAESIYREVLNV